MITSADITAWQGTSPVALNAAQTEQEMLLRRLIIELGNDPLLAGTVVCSGGTTLHQVLLPAPRRYSEDLDLLPTADLGKRDPWPSQMCSPAISNVQRDLRGVRLSRSGNYGKGPQTSTIRSIFQSPRSVVGPRRVPVARSWGSTALGLHAVEALLHPGERIDLGEQVGSGHGGDAVREAEAVGACVHDYEMVEFQVGYGVVHRLGG